MGVNRAGGRSNSGEGGEDEARWTPISDADESGHSPTFPHLRGLRNGDIAVSKVKQIAPDPDPHPDPEPEPEPEPDPDPNPDPDH